jgi:hypothetical protein
MVIVTTTVILMASRTRISAHRDVVMMVRMMTELQTINIFDVS